MGLFVMVWFRLSMGDLVYHFWEIVVIVESKQFRCKWLSFRLSFLYIIETASLFLFYMIR